MRYNAYFTESLTRLRDERRYRVFAELERVPAAFHTPDGSRHRLPRDRAAVLHGLSRQSPAPQGHRRYGRNRDPLGDGAGAARNNTGTTHPLLERELADPRLPTWLVRERLDKQIGPVPMEAFLFSGKY
jgi:5-aminolevulinate synthase